MKRLEPNLLLAVSTVVTLCLLIMTSAVYSAPGGAIKYPIIALICVAAFVIGNGMMAARMGRITPPMISLETPATAVWAGGFPIMVMLFAAIP